MIDVNYMQAFTCFFFLQIDTTEDSEVVFEKLSQYFKEQKQHQVEDVSKPEEGLEERKEEVEEKMESKEEMTDLSNKNIIFVLGKSIFIICNRATILAKTVATEWKKLHFVPYKTEKIPSPLFNVDLSFFFR